MTENTDFLPIVSTLEATEETEGGVGIALAAILWLVFVILLVTTPAVVIAAWRVLL